MYLSSSPFPFSLNAPGATQQNCFLTFLFHPCAHLDSFSFFFFFFFPKSPADLRDDTGRQGRETGDVDTDALSVTDVAGAAAAASRFPGCSLLER